MMTISNTAREELDANLLLDTSLDISRNWHKKNPFEPKYLQFLQTPIHKVSY